MKIVFKQTIMKVLEVDTTEDQDAPEVIKAQYEDQPEDILDPQTGEFSVQVEYYKLLNTQS